jgi:hypothetical protein
MHTGSYATVRLVLVVYRILITNEEVTHEAIKHVLFAKIHATTSYSS